MVNKNAIFVIAVASLFAFCTMAVIPDSEAAVSVESKTVELQLSYESSNGLIAISYGNSQVGGYSQESKLIILASASKADSKAIGWIVDGKVSVKTPAGDDLTYVQLTNPPSGWATAKSLKAELMYDDDGIDPVSVAIVGLTAVVGIAAVALVVGKN